MSKLKTQPTDESVLAYLETIESDKKRSDSIVLLQLMEEITGSSAQMWGSSIIGFGRYQYKYASGRDGEWFLVGFAPRKQNLTLYIMSGFDQYDNLLGQLGKHKTGKACLYIKKLEDVNQDILRELIQQSVTHVASTNG